MACLFDDIFEDTRGVADINIVWADGRQLFLHGLVLQSACPKLLEWIFDASDTTAAITATGSGTTTTGIEP